MDNTPHLKLPYLMPGQAQKHVTHAEGLQLLDAVVHLSVDSPYENTPPATPQNGYRALVGTSPVGAWDGHAGQLAAFLDGTWRFHDPEPGWVCHVASTGEIRVFDGMNWVLPKPAQSTGQLGVSATADAINRFAVSSPASLFNHAGDSHRLTINRASANDHAGILLQTAFGANAEFGLAGADGFVTKVGEVGGNLKEVWRAAINPVSGEAQLLLGTANALDERAPIEVHNHGATAIFNRLAPSGGVMMGFYHQGTRRGQISVGAGGNTFLDGVPGLTIRADGSDCLIVTEQRIEAKAPVRLDHVSGASLPDPAIAGAGSIAYLSSGGSPGLVYSDGADWRYIADNTIAA